MTEEILLRSLCADVISTGLGVERAGPARNFHKDFLSIKGGEFPREYTTTVQYVHSRTQLLLSAAMLDSLRQGQYQEVSSAPLKG